ncbi:MAG TPA: ABC transporter permease [Vicinamibacterales bacterium]|nr:ABC transporter permease [Vicinamibacterales bacterium]
MRLFRALLHLYPSSFRHEYGEEMARLFAERRRGAPLPRRLALWLEVLGDALATAPRIHVDMLRQDLRHAGRTLARSRGFAAAVVLVMALGIGATTAVFSVIDRVLLRPLPFAEPQRLVQVWENVPGYSRLEPSPANYRDWRQMTHGFERLEAYMPNPVNMIWREPERVAGAALTADLLPMLGVQPSLGRLFTPEEGRLGGPASVILSDRLWRRAFGADPAVLGRGVRIEGSTYTIAGVMPPTFYFPDRDTELWMPLTLGPEWFEDRDNNALQVVGRLKPGVTLEGARAEMNGVTAALEAAHPKENAQTRATVRQLGDQVSQPSRLLLRVLAAASVCLLLIACTNLASLNLARFGTRRRELSVRAALGAGQHRLTRQLLTESLVLSLCGGAAGVALAVPAVPLLARLVPTTLPVPDATVLEPRVLLAALAATTATGLLFGMLPALRFSRRVEAAALREGPRGTAGGRERVRPVLVAAQIAASVLLLVGAGLLLRALHRVQAIDPGFDARGVLTVRTPLPMDRYQATAARGAFYERVVDEIQALPGVSAAAYTSFTPMVMRGGIWAIDVPGRTAGAPSSDTHTASLRFITPGYFHALGVPLVRGRDVSRGDTGEAPFVAVVSESFARKYWPDGDAVGQRFTVAFFERLIVGVAGDVRVRGLEMPSEPQVYVPHRQIPDGWMPFYAPKDLVVRTAGDPVALVPAIRRILREVDPELPVSHVRTMEQIVELETAPRRTQAAVIALFATAALLLAGVGLHGLVAYGVAQRRREIGVRMALGATPPSVVGLVVRESVRLSALGGAAGLVAAYLVASRFDLLLAGVPAADPATFIVAILFTGVIAVSGSVVPALRAIAVDPSTALRAE